MKILMPILHYPPVIGGFEVFSQSIAEGISKTDDVFIITSKVINTLNQEIKGNLRIVRTSPLILKDLSYSKPWFIFGAMIWILFKSFKIIKKEKIDLIHSQGFLSGIMAYILKKLTKIPYLITIQSADFSVYHPRLNIKIINKIYQWVEGIIFRGADFCHAVSNYLEDHFKTHRVKRTIVISNGVSQDKFKPDVNKKITRRELGFETENLIVCVSRLEHKNGTHDLVESAKYLDDLDFKIMVCGDGSDREKLEKMIEKFNLMDKVFLVGDILHADLPKYVACGDIFVRPSLAEGFGIVFLEAMAAEVAIIGTPVGGIPDFLRDPSIGSGQATGLFCEPANPKDIAEKIKILIKDKNLRERLIKNAKQMVVDIYNWDKISERLKGVYKQILNKFTPLDKEQFLTGDNK